MKENIALWAYSLMGVATLGIGLVVLLKDYIAMRRRKFKRYAVYGNFNGVPELRVVRARNPKHAWHKLSGPHNKIIKVIEHDERA